MEIKIYSLAKNDSPIVAFDDAIHTAAPRPTTEQNFAASETLIKLLEMTVSYALGYRDSFQV